MLILWPQEALKQLTDGKGRSIAKSKKEKIQVEADIAEFNAKLKNYSEKRNIN